MAAVISSPLAAEVADAPVLNSVAEQEKLTQVVGATFDAGITKMESSKPVQAWGRVDKHEPEKASLLVKPSGVETVRSHEGARSKKKVGFVGSAEDDAFVQTMHMATPRISGGDKTPSFRGVHAREPVAESVAPQQSSLSRPNFEDTLRRVAAVVHRHIEVCERRRAKAAQRAPETLDTGEFRDSAMELFGEHNYCSPQYKMRFVRLPLGRPGAVYAMQKVEQTYARPSSKDIYTFISVLFNRAHLSSECSIVCLIYVERLMEKGNVPLTAQTWRPVLMCALLLAHKVWQDHACWNIEFTQVYPQFSLNAINRLEKRFLERINWQLSIKQSLYAQYYFALRSVTEKADFRQRYNSTVIQAPHMEQLEQRSEAIKQEALSNRFLSMSM